MSGILEGIHSSVSFEEGFNFSMKHKTDTRIYIRDQKKTYKRKKLKRIVTIKRKPVGKSTKNTKTKNQVREIKNLDWKRK